MLANNGGKLLNKYTKDYVIYDLETTGISCKWDEVVEISAIKVENGKIVDEFSSLVNPKKSIPYQASRMNGITDDMVEDAPTFDVVLQDFLDFIGELPLVGHNIHTFDMKFIYRDCTRFFNAVPSNDYIDTLKLSKLYLSELPRHKLTDLAQYYSFSTEGAHRALNDCRMNQYVFEQLGKEMGKKKSNQKNIRKCPLCGSDLQKRNGRFGEFYGCTAYPDCRYTENA